MSKTGYLNIVDKNGNIIGEDTRKNIHEKGLLHIEVHVLFYTPQGEFIFQHRGLNVDTFPNLLDATVGGHVEIGETYEETAIKEVLEETGLTISSDNLIFIKTIYNKSIDKKNNKINNALKKEFAYYFTGNLKDLQIEKNGKSLGFEAWKFAKLFNISSNDKKKIIPFILEEPILSVYKEIEKIFNKHLTK